VYHLCTRNEVLTEVSMQVMVFWDVMLCALFDSYQLLEEHTASNFMITSSAIKTELGGSSYLLIPIYQTVWHLTPDDYNLEQFVNMGRVSQLCLHSTDANVNTKW